jgi:5'-phosphate synthase pdxT subunit
MESYDLTLPLRKLARNGFPIWGTCAGLILMASKVAGLNNRLPGVMNIEVRRNAFGRQVDSFEVDLPVAVLGEPPFHAVFIRAPWIESVGPEVEVLARLPQGPVVAARQGKLLVTAFHPELTADLRFHQYFLKLVAANQ